MVGDQQRVVNVQKLAIGKALKADCECREHTLEALLVPTAAHVRKTVRIGYHQPA